MLRRITQAQYDALSPEMKLLYVADDAGFFKLPLQDYIDPQPLINARDREKEEARVLREQLATANTELTTLRANTPKDVQTLTSAHNQAITELKATLEPRIATLRSELEKTLLQVAAAKVAGASTGTAENALVLTPHVQQRLVIDWQGDVATVKTKKADGTVGDALTDATLDNFKKDFVDDPKFAAIVVKSKASGGGAAGQAGSTQAGSAGKKWADYTPQERAKLSTTDPTAFQALADAHRAEQEASRKAPVRRPTF